MQLPHPQMASPIIGAVNARLLKMSRKFRLVSFRQNNLTLLSALQSLIYAHEEICFCPYRFTWRRNAERYKKISNR